MSASHSLVLVLLVVYSTNVIYITAPLPSDCWDTTVYPKIKSRNEELRVTAPKEVIPNVKNAVGRKSLVAFMSKIHELWHARKRDD
ncbi:hypothetical protein Zmor_012397 [Zophobas morio]|uniref:Uncharacterized protein n=1 Tax=Zophobas morio TaxID=2755281 RepID=A0AA38LYT2_9CUCU|nr:hypothetical protein Zmor_012397 [Zophobas morio]